MDGITLPLNWYVTNLKVFIVLGLGREATLSLEPYLTNREYNFFNLCVRCLATCTLRTLLINSKSSLILLELTSGWHILQTLECQKLPPGTIAYSTPKKNLYSEKRRICSYLGSDLKRIMWQRSNKPWVGFSGAVFCIVDCFGSNFSVIFPGLHSAYVTIRIPKEETTALLFAPAVPLWNTVCCLPPE